MGKFCFIKEGYLIHRIDFDEILFVEAYKNYCKVYLKDRFILALKSMKEMELFLPKESFIRIHRSYIVSIKNITSFENRTVIMDDAKTLPVGENFRAGISSFIMANML